jgi:hypothetical protein
MQESPMLPKAEEGKADSSTTKKLKKNVVLVV